MLMGYASEEYGIGLSDISNQNLYTYMFLNYRIISICITLKPIAVGIHLVPGSKRIKERELAELSWSFVPMHNSAMNHLLGS